MRTGHEYRLGGRGRSRLFVSILFFVVFLLFSTDSRAAYAVYADSWATPTQAQEQATSINRTLDIATATYERATVHGRVFWRVRVGYFASRESANQMRQRLAATGISDSWMRTVDDSEVPTPARRPAPVPTARVDSARAETVARTLIDSMAALTQRAVDSLQTASQVKLDEVLERMHSQVTGEVVRQLEMERARERQTYVTQMEQAQMTRALLEEMHANLEALQDSIAQERRERLRLDALRPVVSGAVSIVGDAAHNRPENAANTTTSRIADPQARIAVSWSGHSTAAVVDIRPTRTDAGLTEAYLQWKFRQSDASVSAIGAGRFRSPYGLESTNRDELFAANPSILSTRRTTFDGMWIEPYRSSTWRLLLLPHGTWDVDNGYYRSLAQVRYTPGWWRFELTGLAGFSDVSGSESESYTGDGVVEWRTDRTAIGAEGQFRRDDYRSGGPEENHWAALLRVHRQFTPILGWVSRGEFLQDDVKTGGITDSYRAIGAVTGPTFTVTQRMSVRATYGYQLYEIDPGGAASSSRDQTHTFSVGFSHSF